MESIESGSAEDISAEPGTSRPISSSEDDSSSEEEVVEVLKNLNENYEDEIETGFAVECRRKDQQNKKGNKPNRARNRSKLPAALRGLMGEANLRYVRGDPELAEKMCYEVIRQEPHAFEPYQTLSQIYEERNKEMSMEFLTIAAHLQPGNTDQWILLADYYIDVKKNYKGAVTCYTRAVRAQKRNYELHLRRIKLLEHLNDHKSVIRCKLYLLHKYSRKCHEQIIELASELVKHYHKEKDYSKAVEAMDVVFLKCKKHISPELVNIYLEVLLIADRFTECLDVFVQYCNIELDLFVNESNKLQVVSFTIPEDLQIDFRFKFTVCLVKLEAFEYVDTLMQPVLDEENIEKNGDLFLDVSEALMSKSRFTDALKLLTPLVHSTNFSLAAVWLKYADCLKEVNRTADAIDAYNVVVKLAPMHIAARHPLTELLLAAGRHAEALEAFKQDPEALELDVELLLKQMDVLKKHSITDEYMKCVEVLLSRHCVTFKHSEEMRVVLFQETYGEKVARINKIRERYNDEPVATAIITSVREPRIEDEYKIYRDALNYCYVNGHYAKLKKFAFMGMCSQRFKTFQTDIAVAVLYGSMLTRDAHLVFPILRDALIRRPVKIPRRLWNTCSILMRNMGESRTFRLLVRQEKSLKYPFIKLIQTCLAVSAGSYRIANIYLLSYLKQQPCPFIFLLLGICCLQISCQKYVEVKTNVTQCCYGFFSNYANKRGKLAQQEVYYNLGRLYHQYGVNHLAVHYYNLVLEYQHEFTTENAHILDLTKEAAHNLCLIYKESKNYIGAMNVMRKYLTI